MKLQLKLISAAVMASVISSSMMAAYGPAPASYSKKPCPWTVSLGYGQSFDMDKGSYSVETATATDTYSSPANVRSVKLDDLKLYEADLFHCSGFGAVVMGTAKKATMTGAAIANGTAPYNAAVQVGKYSFTAVMLGYKMNLGNNISARVAVGQADQKISDMSIAGPGLNTATTTPTTTEIKQNGKMAANIEAKYHFRINKNMTAFIAGGYLNLDDINKTIVQPFQAATTSPEVSASGVRTIVKQDASSGYVKLGVSFVM